MFSQATANAQWAGPIKNNHDAAGFFHFSGSEQTKYKRKVPYRNNKNNHKWNCISLFQPVNGAKAVHVVTYICG